MTLMSYGRATPIQIDMLCLAGGVSQQRDITTSACDEDRIESMRIARSQLVRRTTFDFGYDLQEWHRFLVDDVNDAFGYRHPYAWSTVKKAIERFIEDADRVRLVDIIRERYPAVPGSSWELPLQLTPKPLDAKHYEQLKQGGPINQDAFVQPGARACPECGKLLRTAKAKQCFRCGANWH